MVLAAALVAGACHDTSSQSAKPQPMPVGTPVAAPITGSIGPDGGTLATPDGKLIIQVPAGALPSVTQLSIQPVTNTAPHGFGTAYQLEPSGTTFRKLVTLTFSTKDVGAPIENVGVAYQDATGYWAPVLSALRNRQAQLITVLAPHFSGWALVPSNPQLDLAGSFQITSTLDLPFTAVGNASVGYAGEDANERYYLLSGSTTLQPGVTENGAVCSPPAPDASGVTPNPAAVYTFPTNLVEGFKSASDPTTYTKLWWGTSAHWNLACGANPPYLLEMAFDTVGINHLSCARGYTAGTTPTLTQDQLAGDYTIDCSNAGGGTLRGQWSWLRCGGTCTSDNPCATQTAYDCTASPPVCAVTQTAAPGTPCTTSTISQGVCNTAGTCTACAAKTDCTATAQATDPCVATAQIDCSTGQEQCLATSYKAAGTTCTTSTGGAGTCSPAGTNTPSTCVACVQGSDCTSTLTTNDPCIASATVQCGTGVPTCTVQSYKPAGTTCTTSTGGPGTCSPSSSTTASTCVSCDPTATCTSTNDCAATTITDCSTGVPGCTVLTYKTAGSPCGLVNGTYTGVCSATTPSTCNTCTQGADCSSQVSGNSCVSSAKIDCTSGSPVCVPTYLTPGSTCLTSTSTTGYCNSTSNTCETCPGSCTLSDSCVATAQYVCSTGTPVCTAQTYKSPGDPCTGGVCTSSSPPVSVCTPCVVGSACTPNSSNPCVDPSATWTVSACNATGPVCSPSAYLADGTNCGASGTTGSFCLAGVCTSTCTNQGCVPSTNPCDTGTMDCATFACVDSFAPAPTGTVCNAATGATCAACTTSSCTVGSQCGATGACIQNTPVTAAAVGSVCNGTATCGACVTTDCKSGVICQDGTSTTCVASADATSICVAPQTCNAGTCQ